MIAIIRYSHKRLVSSHRRYAYTFMYVLRGRISLYNIVCAVLVSHAQLHIGNSIR